MAVNARSALWIDGACGLFGAGVHVVVAALGGLGVAPNAWRTFAAVSVIYAAIAWASTRSRSPESRLTQMIWMNRGWVAFCVVAAAVIATGLARLLLGGEAVVVGALSVWESRIRTGSDARSG